VTTTDGTRPLWGEATEHAIRAFPITGRPMPRRFLIALVEIKRAAAQSNLELGLLDETRAQAIVAACDRVLAGGYWQQFPVDVYQTGSATSSNMNVNEVLASLAGDLAGTKVRPHEHVNRCQSSNDVVPTAMRLATSLAITEELLPALAELESALTAKARQFWDVIKVARTHLQDATPIRLGQEFWGYADQVAQSRRRLAEAVRELATLPLGGTAVGTGLNAHTEFAARTIGRLERRLGLDLTEAPNHFSAQSNLDAVIAAHGTIRTTASALYKIATDLRLLATGPRAGLGELRVPDVGVSSSIMPGKVPPSVIESLTMAVARVIGNDATVAFCQVGSVLELNVMMPVVIDSLLESIGLLAASSRNLSRQCVAGIEATGVGPANVRGSIMLITALSPRIGYAAAAEISTEAAASGEDVEIVAARHGIDSERFAAWCDPAAMTGSTTAPPT
jgi:fumarate hydratase class II